MVSTRVSAAVSSEVRQPALVNMLRLRMLEAWHLLSLDAPTVATVWLLFAAKTFAVRLPSTMAPAMFLLVWLLYAADRLLDARRAFRLPAAERDELAARHYFHHRHRGLFLAVAAAVAVLLVPLIAGLPVTLLELYALLGVLLVGWLMLVHRAPRLRARVMSKELAVGLFFAPAVMMPVLDGGGVYAWTATVLLMALCTVNCLAIESWEARGAGRARAALLLAVVGSAGAAASWYLRGPWVVFAALALSALLLAGLGRARERLTATTLRAAADLVLLTPLLFGLWR